jgi:hypothetical protein
MIRAVMEAIKTRPYAQRLIVLALLAVLAPLVNSTNYSIGDIYALLNALVGTVLPQ